MRHPHEMLIEQQLLTHLLVNTALTSVRVLFMQIDFDQDFI